MSSQNTPQTVDVPALQEHLSEALEAAESPATRYHLREASQKVAIMKSDEL